MGNCLLRFTQIAEFREPRLSAFADLLNAFPDLQQGLKPAADLDEKRIRDGVRGPCQQISNTQLFIDRVRQDAQR